ncbi:carboxymuconolactone decarboxylase family protein [Ponticoccus sp. SC6-36]|nr:carboxymuconolactone decarboxylase family protein [Ponticoccus sp. SC6-36]
MPDAEAGPLTDRQREVIDRIRNGPRGAVQGPLRVWVHSPELADRAQALGAFVRFDSSLTPIQSELAILVTARIWSSGFEWAHHAPIAAREGLPDAVIDAIAQGRQPSFDRADLQAIFDFSVELHRDRAVSDATFEAAIAEVGQVGTVDLTGICGYYTLISMTINAFAVPDGEGPRLPRLDMAPEAMFRD